MEEYLGEVQTSEDDAVGTSSIDGVELAKKNFETLKEALNYVVLPEKHQWNYGTNEFGRISKIYSVETVTREDNTGLIASKIKEAGELENRIIENGEYP